MQHLLHQAFRRGIVCCIVARASMGRDSTAPRANRRVPSPRPGSADAIHVDGEARRALEVQRQRLWRIAYRLTGSAADADDVVQEALVRWVEHSAAGPPPTGGWLIRVATHLGIDALRARRRRGYVGSWLPEPIVGSDDESLSVGEGHALDAEVRFGLAESATLAFLVALEALTPVQRAVFLLRDVFDYSAAEAAECVGTSEGNVRVLHLRARRALASYDLTRCVPTNELRDRHHATLDRLLQALRLQDGRALENLLSETVRTVTDGGGEFTALREPLVGRARVSLFYLRAALNRAARGPMPEIKLLNGLPAALITLARPVRKQAPLTVMSLQLAPDGRIQEIYTVLASAKLAALRAC
jgi:RNA polymerase sigma factor (sigma-70 family)